MASPQQPQGQRLEQVTIHVALSLTAMLAVALTAIQRKTPKLIRSIKHYTA